jgi:hypothetical protein
MSISCKCTTRNKGLEPLNTKIEVELSKFPPAQKLLLESGEFEWMPVSHFERMLGLRRQAVKELISSGELVAYEIPQNPKTKLGYGRRAFVAVQTFPCNTCCPDHYKLNWEEHVRFGKSER